MLSSMQNPLKLSVYIYIQAFLHGEIWCSMLKDGVGYGTQNRRFSLEVLFKNIFLNIQISSSVIEFI